MTELAVLNTINAVFIIVSCALLSMAFASYYGVIISRGLKDSFVGRSYCDGCKRQLHWYENIPLLSALYLQLFSRGKTTCCGEKITTNHLFAEAFALVTGIILGLIVVKLLSAYQGFSVDYVFLGVMYLIFLFLAVEDIWEYAVLNNVVMTLLAIALLRYIFLLLIPGSLLSFSWLNLVAALVYAGFWQFLIYASKGKGLGSGDVLIGAFIGLALGWQLTVASFYFSVIVGSLIGLVFAAYKRKLRGLIIPMVPFLFLGTLLAILFTDKVLATIQWLSLNY